METAIVRNGGVRAQAREVASGWTKARRRTFLDVLASSANVRLSGAAAGMSNRACYHLRYRDPVFAGLWDEALATGYERIEQALIERAHLGVDDLEIGGALPRLIDTPESGLSPKAAVATDGRVEMDVKLAQWLLDRHDRRVRKGADRIASRQPTREAVEAKLLKKLDALASRQAAP